MNSDSSSADGYGDKKKPGPVTDNPWHRLRDFTAARIALGRAGVSLPTQALLAFQLDHARAQDAVHLPLDVDRLAADLQPLLGEQPLLLHSQANDRFHYLQRPDLGRRLNDSACERLEELADIAQEPADLAVVIADGLSSQAVQHNTLPMLEALFSVLKNDADSWRLAPVTLVEQARVAIGDDIGQRLNARAVLVMIGERPGLSSPDSLGLYLTWAPQPGRSDAERNCISNVRPAGLGYTDAASRLLYLLRESRRLQLTGVGLKDRTETDVIASQDGAGNFLLGGT